MSKVLQKPKLESPILVYILGICFLFAPLGNLILTALASGIQDWYLPQVFSLLISDIPLMDWIWFGLVMMSGLALLKPHKLSWSLAIFTMAVVLLINVYKIALGGLNLSLPLQKLQVFSSIVMTGSVALIAFYFRFPYLDRRSQFIKKMHRYSVDILGEIKSNRAQAVIQGRVRSISFTGFMIEVASGGTSFQKGDKIKICIPEVSSDSFTAEVVSFEQGEQKNRLRASFEKLNQDQEKIILTWLES